MHIKELLKIEVKNPDIYVKEFKSLLKEIKKDEYDFKDKDYNSFLIINEIRLDSFFVHIVPKELFDIFNKMKDSNPEQFLGFSILAGKRLDKPVRLSCFGIPCSELTKAIISKARVPPRLKSRGL